LSLSAEADVSFANFISSTKISLSVCSTCIVGPDWNPLPFEHEPQFKNALWLIYMKLKVDSVFSTCKVNNARKSRARKLIQT
jgi:hypothetical protein